MSNADRIKDVINNKINNDIDWANPYWIDEIKVEFSNEPEDKIDNIYYEELKLKLDSLSENELNSIMDEQNSLTSANQNYLLQNFIEEKLSQKDS